MTIEEAREYWCRRLERADGYSDEHWDAEERHAHADYVDAMTHAIAALSIRREQEAVKHPKSNGDRIRQMTDEELAEFIETVTDCCSVGWMCDKCPIKSNGCDKESYIEWLKQEVSEDAGTD